MRAPSGATHMRGFVRFVLFALTVYVASCAVLFVMQHWLIFHPRPVGHRPVGPHVEPVTVRRDDAALRGWVVHPESTGPLVVYFGGNAEDVSGRIGDFASLDATTALISYRGYGDSDGRPTATDLIEDAGVVVRAMRERFGEGREIILFGRSLGTGVAALAAAGASVDAPVDGLILLSPYVSLGRIAAQRFPAFPVRWLLRHDIDASTVGGALPDRVLVLYSLSDGVVPTAESRAFVELLHPAPEVVEFDGVHHVSMTSPPIWDAIRKFLYGEGGSA